MELLPVNGSDGLSPKPLNPAMLMLGRPQLTGGGSNRPSPTSLWTSRLYCSSCERLLKNFVAPKRSSLTTLGESVRVLDTITCLTFVSTTWPLSFRFGSSTCSSVQLNRPNQNDFGPSTKSMRCVN